MISKIFGAYFEDIAVVAVAALTVFAAWRWRIGLPVLAVSEKWRELFRMVKEFFLSHQRLVAKHEVFATYYNLVKKIEAASLKKESYVRDYAATGGAAAQLELREAAESLATFLERLNEESLRQLSEMAVCRLPVANASAADIAEFIRKERERMRISIAPAENHKELFEGRFAPFQLSSEPDG